LKKLDVSGIDMPDIELTDDLSSFYSTDEDPFSIFIRRKHIRDSIENKIVQEGIFQISAESALIDDIVHEPIHYIQNHYYDHGAYSYETVSEGVAMAASDEILYATKYPELRTFVVRSITNYFLALNTKYQPLFKLTKKDEKRVMSALNQSEKVHQQIDERYAKAWFKVMTLKKKHDLKDYSSFLKYPFRNRLTLEQKEITTDFDATIKKVMDKIIKELGINKSVIKAYPKVYYKKEFSRLHKDRPDLKKYFPNTKQNDASFYFHPGNFIYLHEYCLLNAAEEAAHCVIENLHDTPTDLKEIQKTYNPLSGFYKGLLNEAFAFFCQAFSLKVWLRKQAVL